MTLPSSETRCAGFSKGIYGIRSRHLIMALLASSAFAAVTGCSSAVGTDLAPREDILKTLRSQGYLFNKHVISTVQGATSNQVIVSGQLAQKTPDERHVPNGFKVTQYRQLVVENAGGAWQVTNATPVQREQLSSRQRW